MIRIGILDMSPFMVQLHEEDTGEIVSFVDNEKLTYEEFLQKISPLQKRYKLTYRFLAEINGVEVEGRELFGLTTDTFESLCARYKNRDKTTETTHPNGVWEVYDCSERRYRPVLEIIDTKEE